jgi:hypothetical protein
MKYMICLREDAEAPITQILGFLEHDSANDAIATARTVLGPDPLENHPHRKLVAFEVQTLHLVKQDVYLSIKTNPQADLNEGAISKNAHSIYVDGIAMQGLSPRMRALKFAIPEVKVLNNTRPNGEVMGQGGGVGYNLYAAFKKPEEAVEYIKKLGYEVKGRASFD